MMKLLQGFMKKLWITNKTEFWIEKVTKGKDDKLYVRWKYNLLFELTKKILIYASKRFKSCYPEPESNIKN